MVIAATSPQAEVDARPSGLRRVAARGTVINAGFLVGLNVLTLFRGFIVAAFLTTTDYGIWGVLGVILGSTVWLKDVGITDKFVQQREADQELAFQRAFTLEVVVTCTLALLMAIAMPVFGALLGQPRIVVPGLVMALIIPAIGLQSPIWVFYRDMKYLRQRQLQSVEPIVGFVVTVGLAVAGFGYWSLVIGALAGAYSGAVVALVSSPYRLRLRFERDTARDYVSFSWPLLVASGSGLLIGQVSVFGGQAAVGLAGVGAIALASQVTRYANQVDEIVTNTLYPAVCRVRDRTDLLFESFVKSNRLALMWGVPFGVGVTLFAQPFVSHVIGTKWQDAVVLLEMFGFTTAASQIGFSWTAYYRAIGDTRPFATVAVLTLVAFCVGVVPGLLRGDLDWFAYGMGFMTIVNLALRAHYIRKLFPSFRMLKHSARAVGPSVPAVGAVLAARAVAGDGGGGQAAAELALYGVVTLAATAVLERRLLLEVLGYLRGRGFVTGGTAD